MGRGLFLLIWYKVFSRAWIRNKRISKDNSALFRITEFPCFYDERFSLMRLENLLIYQSKKEDYKMRKRVLLIGSLCSIMILNSCVARLGTFSVISTKNIDWSRASTYTRSTFDKKKGKDLAHIIIFIPTQFNPTIEDAVDQAIEKVPGGVALVDAVVRYREWWFLYGQIGYSIEGTVLVDPNLVDLNGCNSEETTYYVARIKEGQMIMEVVDAETYDNLSK